MSQIHGQIEILRIGHLNCLIRLKQLSTYGADRDGEIVDNLKPNERMFLLHQLPTSEPHQYEVAHDPLPQLQTFVASSRKGLEENTSPTWWFHHFEPVWKPFIYWLRSQRTVSLLEFEQAASQVPGLTPIEKTIAISVFRQQQERGVAPSCNTTAVRRDRSLSSV